MRHLGGIGFLALACLGHLTEFLAVFLTVFGPLLITHTPPRHNLQEAQRAGRAGDVLARWVDLSQRVAGEEQPGAVAGVAVAAG